MVRGGQRNCRRILVLPRPYLVRRKQTSVLPRLRRHHRAMFGLRIERRTPGVPPPPSPLPIPPPIPPPSVEVFHLFLEGECRVAVLSRGSHASAEVFADRAPLRGGGDWVGFCSCWAEQLLHFWQPWMKVSEGIVFCSCSGLLSDEPLSSAGPRCDRTAPYRPQSARGLFLFFSLSFFRLDLIMFKFIDPKLGKDTIAAQKKITDIAKLRACMRDARWNGCIVLPSICFRQCTHHVQLSDVWQTSLSNYWKWMCNTAN